MPWYCVTKLDVRLCRRRLFSLKLSQFHSLVFYLHTRAPSCVCQSCLAGLLVMKCRTRCKRCQLLYASPFPRQDIVSSLLVLTFLMASLKICSCFSLRVGCLVLPAWVPGCLHTDALGSRLLIFFLVSAEANKDLI